MFKSTFNTDSSCYSEGAVGSGLTVLIFYECCKNAPIFVIMIVSRFKFFRLNFTHFKNIKKSITELKYTIKHLMHGKLIKKF